MLIKDEVSFTAFICRPNDIDVFYLFYQKIYELSQIAICCEYLGDGKSLWTNLWLTARHVEGQNWLKLLKITALSKKFPLKRTDQLAVLFLIHRGYKTLMYQFPVNSQNCPSDFRADVRGTNRN